MGLTDYIAGQARKPTGKFGTLFARSMNSGHGPLTQWGLSHVDIDPTDYILDIGCGGGNTVNRLAGIASHGKVYGIDYSEVSVTVATRVNKKYIDREIVEIIQASVENLPFPGETFDLVTAVETCYFWPDLAENLKEIHRVLKTGGSLLLINEAYGDDRFETRNSKWAKAGDFNLFSPEELVKFLEEAGYSSIQTDVISAKNWLTATGIKENG